MSHSSDFSMPSLTHKEATVRSHGYRHFRLQAIEISTYSGNVATAQNAVADAILLEKQLQHFTNYCVFPVLFLLIGNQIFNTLGKDFTESKLYMLANTTGIKGVSA